MNYKVTRNMKQWWIIYKVGVRNKSKSQFIWWEHTQEGKKQGYSLMEQ